MNLTEWAIRKSRVTVALAVGVAVAGLHALWTLPRAEDPGFTIRAAMVVTLYPGGTADEVERLVTDRLEEAFAQLAPVKRLVSESRREVSYILVEMEAQYHDLDPSGRTCATRSTRSGRNCRKVSSGRGYWTISGTSSALSLRFRARRTVAPN